MLDFLLAKLCIPVSMMTTVYLIILMVLRSIKHALHLVAEL